MENIVWQRNKFIKFFAKMRIRVGGAAPVDIQKDDEFEYDGSILKYSGMEIASPQLRGAINNGWAEPDSGETKENQESKIEAIRPSRNIAKAQTVNKDLSRVQRISEGKINTSSIDEDEILKVSDRGEVASKSQPKILKSDDNRKARELSIQSDITDNQEAVAIGRVRTSAKAVFKDVDKPESAKLIQKLNDMSNVKAELYQKTVEKEGVKISTNVGKVNKVSEADEDTGETVAKVKSSQSKSVEGIQIKDTSNIRNASKNDKDFVIPKNVDPRIRIARTIDPGFPLDWSFSGKLAERLENVKKHGANPKFLEALFAAEGDQMRKTLVKEFPKQFGS